MHLCPSSAEEMCCVTSGVKVQAAFKEGHISVFFVPMSIAPALSLPGPFHLADFNGLAIDLFMAAGCGRTNSISPQTPPLRLLQRESRAHRVMPLSTPRERFLLSPYLFISISVSLSLSFSHMAVQHPLTILCVYNIRYIWFQKITLDCNTSLAPWITCQTIRPQQGNFFIYRRCQKVFTFKGGMDVWDPESKVWKRKEWNS